MVFNRSLKTLPILNAFLGDTVILDSFFRKLPFWHVFDSFYV